MKLKEVTSLEAPELEAYSTLTEAQLRNRLEPEKGLFIAESPKVINVALDAGFEPVSLLCEQKHIQGDASGIIERCPADMPVYTGSRELLAQLTGYTLTRGVLCAMRRPKPLSPEEVCKEARRIVVLHGVCDTTNVGAIFRSAAALGIDALLMTRDSCDPLNRRAVRVSMGSVFLVPWTWLDAEDGTPAGTVHKLRDMGFTTAAMALRKDDVNIAAAQADRALGPHYGDRRRRFARSRHRCLGPCCEDSHASWRGQPECGKCCRNSFLGIEEKIGCDYISYLRFSQSVSWSS